MSGQLILSQPQHLRILDLLRLALIGGGLQLRLLYVQVQGVEQLLTQNEMLRSLVKRQITLREMQKLLESILIPLNVMLKHTVQTQTNLNVVQKLQVLILIPLSEGLRFQGNCPTTQNETLRFLEVQDGKSNVMTTMLDG